MKFACSIGLQDSLKPLGLYSVEDSFKKVLVTSTIYSVHLLRSSKARDWERREKEGGGREVKGKGREKEGQGRGMGICLLLNLSLATALLTTHPS